MIKSIIRDVAADLKSPVLTMSPESIPIKEDYVLDQRRFSKWLSFSKTEYSQNQLEDIRQLSIWDQLKKARQINAEQNQRFFLENQSYFIINCLSFVIQTIYAYIEFEQVWARINLGIFMSILNLVGLIYHLTLIPVVQGKLAKEVNQSGDIKKQIIQNHYKKNKKVKVFYIILVFLNTLLAVEFEFLKFVEKENQPQNHLLQMSLGFTKSSIEKGYFQYITIYSVCFLYSLFYLPKQITVIDDNTISLLQIVGFSYFQMRYLICIGKADYWQLLYSSIIVFSMLYKKSFWDYFTKQQIEREITGQIKNGLIRNLKSFYNNVFELLPQGIAIIDSEKDLVFNNSSIQNLLDCKSSQIVQQIQSIILKKKENKDESNLNSMINPQSNIVNNISDLPVNIKKSPSAPDCSHILDAYSYQNGKKWSYLDNQEIYHQIPILAQKRNSKNSIKSTIPQIQRITKQGGVIQQNGKEVQQYENLEQVINELLQFGQRNKYKQNIKKRVNTVFQETIKQQQQLIEGDQQNIQFSDDSVSIQYNKGSRHFLLKIFICEYSIQLNSTKKENMDEVDFVEPVLLVILEDISDQVNFFQKGDSKQSNIFNQILKKELELITKFRMKMLTSISHELKTPLNFSINTLQNLNGQIDDNIYKHEISPALACNKYLFNVFNDILDYSTIEAKKFQYKFQSFSLKDILQDCLEIMDFQSKFKNIQMILNYDQNISEKIFSDPSRIRQIVLNLLSNAIKFTYKGSVTLSAEQIEENQIQISVQDTGIGINKENQNIIFNLCGKIQFLKQSDKYQVNTQGIGLGLTVSSQIVKGLSSRSRDIKLVSEVDKGSRFSFLVQNYANCIPVIQDSSVPFINSQQQIIVQNVDEEIEVNQLPLSNPFKSNYRSSSKYLDKLDVHVLQMQSSIQKPALFIVDSCDISRQQSIQDLDIQLPQASFNPKFKELSGDDEMFISVDRVINLKEEEYTKSPFSQFPSLTNNDISQIHRPLINEITCPDTSNLNINQSNVSLQLDIQKSICKCIPYLYIDDNEFNLQILKNMIKKLGFECDVALSGQIGIDKIISRFKTNKCCPHYQMIFCDIDMPIKNGYETTTDILNFYKQQKVKNTLIPIITACTALNFPDFQTKCFETGMKFFLPKPVDINSLKEIILKEI